MNVVELINRLADEDCHLEAWDLAGPVWTRRPPEAAKPWIERLELELLAAYRGARNGYAWGQCQRCGRAAMTEPKATGVACWVTPHCKAAGGKLTAWARLPAAVERWRSMRQVRCVVCPAIVGETPKRCTGTKCALT